MNGLPDSVDLSFFKGVCLEQVRIGEYQIELWFSDDVSIAVEGNISISDIAHLDVHAAGKELVELLGATVTSAVRLRRGDLKLRLSTGCDLVILDSNDELESYVIEGPLGPIVV